MKKPITGPFAAAFCAATLAGCATESRSPTYHERDPAPRAIQCSAAFELMARAAPKWSSQGAVQQARYAWASHVNSVSGNAGVDPRGQVNLEMELLAETTADDPNFLTDLATQCIADAPTRRR